MEEVEELPPGYQGQIYGVRSPSARGPPRRPAGGAGATDEGKGAAGSGGVGGGGSGGSGGGGGSGSGGRGGGGGRGRGPPLLGVPYADTPAQANVLSLIDYSTSQGLKLWHLTTAGLQEKFGCKEHQVLLFLEA
eukprot:10746234-Ditylum_brightwellii.AAC.1